MNLFEQALQCLQIDDPQKKVEATLRLDRRWQQNALSMDKSVRVIRLPRVGRPEKPELVDPRNVPRRSFTTLKGRLTLAHAIAHIEFNAINLALDAVYRFQGMPRQYYTDWCRVAAEEAEHFTMLTVYLQQHGMAYGDLPAHNGLWEMAVKTDFDVLVRMALVPRVLEARGLDVTPGMIRKLEAIGDDALVKRLQVIFNEEIGHVKIGTHWYKHLCHQRGLEPEATFLALIDEHMAGARFGPFETEARIEAGFTEDELQSLLEHFRRADMSKNLKNNND
ncbi:MAG TPA: ferritin-like domain-containing protein [Gammaproteobacteria bacterium]|nr:ferritin-like domain-containing protein [Gammaproteobacteria bacterium]